VGAVLFATAGSTGGGPTAALTCGGKPLLARLLGQLAELQASRAWVLTRPGWDAELRAAAPEPPIPVEIRTGADTAADLRDVAELASDTGGPLLVAPAGVLAHAEALANLLADPRVATGRLISAKCPPGCQELGLLLVDPRSLGALAEVAAEPPGEIGDVPGLLAEGLARRGVPVTPVDLRELYWARPGSQPAADQAAAELAARDEDRARLDSAVKSSDGFFTTFFVSPYSRFLARFAARRGWTPNGVTTASMGLGVVAAALFGTGLRSGLIAGALVLQAAFTLDCVDGQLARYTRTFSAFGAWLDSVFDRGKEYLCYAGLAVGSLLGFAENVWLLAAAALGLQTIRHAMDFSYAAGRPRGAGGGGAARLSGAFERRSWTRWPKKIITLPIGERFALISITAAVATPRVTFLALLIWGGVALVYQLAGKVSRSVAA
jgi:phosphatidylglycerophosphate synthase